MLRKIAKELQRRGFKVDEVTVIKLRAFHSKGTEIILKTKFLLPFDSLQNLK